MANPFLDFAGDPFNNDVIPAGQWTHVQSVGYGGAYSDLTGPASPNFNGRYFLYLPGIPDTTNFTTMPFLVKDVTTSTVLTRVSTTPGANQFRYCVATGNPPTYSTRSPNVIELNSGQANHVIAYDFYAIGSVMNANEANRIMYLNTLTSSILNGTIANITTGNITTANITSLIMAGAISGATTIGMNGKLSGEYNRKIYYSGNTYNSVLLSVTGNTGWSTTRGTFIVKYHNDGTYHLWFDIQGSWNGNSHAIITVAGITSKNISNYSQAFAVSSDVFPNNLMGFISNNVNYFEVYNDQASVRKINFIGEIELDGKPTWAD